LAAPMHRMPHSLRRIQAGLVGVLLLAGGCNLLGSRSRTVLPDDQFGHRYEGFYGGRETIGLAAPDTSRTYFFYPAVVESLHVRHAAFNPELAVEAQQVEVEVLVKGILPDDCSELHDLEQWNAGHIINLTLRMRRPVGAVCSRAGLPYRFYALMEGEYEAGDYIIKMDDGVYPFTVRPRL
jgi:hypothetical protein